MVIYPLVLLLITAAIKGSRIINLGTRTILIFILVLTLNIDTLDYYYGELAVCVFLSSVSLYFRGSLHLTWYVELLLV